MLTTNSSKYKGKGPVTKASRKGGGEGKGRKLSHCLKCPKTKAGRVVGRKKTERYTESPQVHRIRKATAMTAFYVERK